MSEAAIVSGLEPGYYAATLPGGEEFYFKVNRLDGLSGRVLYVWGFSVYEGEPGYRTLGIRYDDWRGRYGDVTVRPDHDRTQDGLKGLAERESARTAPVGTGDTAPTHYGSDTYEVYKVINAWDLNFNLGCVVKYIARLGKKPGVDPIRDLVAARDYINFEIERRKRLV